jgi:hypothetical protein
MDRAMATVNVDDPRLEQRLRRELAPLKTKCRWTSGSWEDLNDIDWDKIQNVPSHVRLLTDYVQRVYLAG